MMILYSSEGKLENPWEFQLYHQRCFKTTVANRDFILGNSRPCLFHHQRHPKVAVRNLVSKLCLCLKKEMNSLILKLSIHISRDNLSLWLRSLLGRKFMVFFKNKIRDISQPGIFQSLAGRLPGFQKPSRLILEKLFQSSSPGIYQSVAGRSSSQGLNLNRSQFGGCSTKYNTLAGT